MKHFFIAATLFFSSFQDAYTAPAIKEDTVALLTPKLNSDRISYFFGSYGVEPIPVHGSPFGESRVANLFSLENGEKVMRTLAVVEFHQPVHESLMQVHREICEGQSIGIALRNQGWKIDKIPVYFGSAVLSSQLQEWMHEKSKGPAAVHVYQLDVYQEGAEERLPYCKIIEVHSPQYLDEHWLQALYPDQFENYRKSSRDIEALRQSLDTLIAQFPNEPRD